MPPLRYFVDYVDATPPTVGSSTDSIVLSAGRLAAPADADHYGVGGTDIRAVTAVDAIDRPFRQTLAV